MKVETQKREEILVSQVIGDLDAIGYVSLVDALEVHLHEKEVEMILDLSRVEYINSLCMGFIVQFWRDIIRGSGFFAIAGARGEVDRLLRVGGIDRLINSYRDVDQAIAGCRAGDNPRTLLGDQGLVDLVKNFARVSLSRAVDDQVKVVEGAPKENLWVGIDLSGALDGFLGVSIDDDSRDTFCGRLLKAVPDFDRPEEALEQLAHQLIYAVVSGLEDMGYAFQVGDRLQPRDRSIGITFGLESDHGTVWVGVQLRKNMTRRIRRPVMRD